MNEKKKADERLPDKLTEAQNILSESTYLSTGDVEQIVDILSEKFASSIEIRIINQTPYVLKPYSHYAEHGNFAPDMIELPAIAPEATLSTGESFVFEVAVAGLPAGQAPTVVAIWQVMDVPNANPIYMVVYADIWHTGDNEGFYILSYREMSAKDRYKYCDEASVDYGSVPTLKMSLGPLSISGSLTNDHNAKMAITLNVG